MRIIIASIFTVLLAGFTLAYSQPTDLYEIQIVTEEDRYNLMVEKAVTLEEKAEGLMGRWRLPVDRGMLFIYKRPEVVSFWMKNMRIPLDILYLDTDMKITQIEHSVPPCRTEICNSYGSLQPVQYVLELQSGFSRRHDVQVGDYVIQK